MRGLRNFFGRDLIVHIGIDHGKTRGKIRPLTSVRKGKQMLSQLKLNSLYIVAAIALAAWLAFSIILATKGAKSSIVSAELKPEPLNTIEWFGKPPALVTTPTPTPENTVVVQAPTFTLFGTSLFGRSRLALIGPVGQAGDGGATSKWVEQGETVEGKYRIKSVTNRAVVIGLEDGKEEWTLNLPVSAPGTLPENGTAPLPAASPPAKDIIEPAAELPSPSALNNKGFNSNGFKALAVANPSSKKCDGVIKVPKMAIDVLNQQQAMLARGLESQAGGGLRIRAELASLVGGLGFMAGDILTMSDTIPLTSSAELLNSVISPLSQGKEITIHGKRGNQQRQWRLVNEIMC